MEKTFRDILDEILEENLSTETASSTHKTHVFPSETALFEPSWRPNFTQIRRPRANVYASPTSLKDHQNQIPLPTEKPKPNSPEILIPLEQLPKNEHSCVKDLIMMGAKNLTQGLSESRLKKAHRHLAKRIHPDHLPPTASANEVKTASATFMKLTKAYNTLRKFLKGQQLVQNHEPAKAA